MAESEMGQGAWSSRAGPRCPPSSGHVTGRFARARTCRRPVYRRLAAIASTAVKSVQPIEIQLGFIDSLGYDAGTNPALTAFGAIPAELLLPRDNDLFGEAGYRFWVVLRDDVRVLAVEQQEGLAWIPHHEAALSLRNLYQESRRQLLLPR